MPKNPHRPFVASASTRGRSRAHPWLELLEDRTLLSVGTGLRAEYYAPHDFTNLAAVRIDPRVDYDWGADAPADAGLTVPDHFAIRWTGQVEAAFSETYTFRLTSDDGVRLWVDGRLLVDNWTEHGATVDIGTVALVAGRRADLVLEYFENGGNALVRLEWSSPSQPLEVVPTERLYPSPRGTILWEYWDDIRGSRVAALTASPDFPDQPSGAHQLTSFESPRRFGDRYGARARGYLHAPVTGRYELYIAADEQAELWLSTDKDPANARLVASVPDDTRPRQWRKYDTQKVVVDLVAGQTYYIEALHKEARGRDHLAVGWRPPGAARIEVIPGNFLSPVRPSVRLYVDQSAASELGTVAAAFTVVRDDDLSRDLVVHYALSGTATNGVDYAELPGTVTIPAGARTATFFVVPIDDTEVEGSESVTVTLLDDARYTLGTPSSRGGSAALSEDDGLPPGTNALFADTPGAFQFAATVAGTTFASRSVVPVDGLPFSQANRVVTTTRPSNNFDVRLWTRTDLPQSLAPVTAGDTLLLTFWARNANPDGAPAQIRAVYERAADPFTKSLSTSPLQLLGPDWQRIDLAFRAAETYDSVALRGQFYLALGFEPQTVEVGGVTITNYGPTIAPEDLPVSGQTYQGRAGTDAAWRDAAEARIEEHRKADLDVQVRDADGNPISGAVVELRLTEHAFGFGSAVAADGINNTHPVNGPNYRAVIEQYFNKVVLENDLKWPGWLSNPARAINAVEWLYAHGIDDVRGHNLIWPGWRFMPASLGNTYGGINYRSDPNKQDSQEEYEAHVAVDGREAADAWLRQRVLDHITEEAGHPALRGRLRDWDVVNEPFSNHDVQDRLSATYGVDGREFLVEWFQAADAADPDARLFLNDFPSLGGSAHLDDFFTTIQYLLERGAPLEGIGFQGHFGTSTLSMDVMFANLERFAGFGLPLQITEFDQESRDEQLQADYLRDFMTLAFSHPSMDAFLMWGFWRGRMNRPDGALWDLDWSIRPNGQQWIDLVTAEWHTDVTGSTFADGNFRARGFLGTYELVVHAGGRTITLHPELTAGGTTVVVTFGDEPPALAGIESGPLAYAAGDGPKVVSPAITVASPDGGLVEGATVQISAGYTADQDVLEFADTAGITGAWDSATGMLTLTGAATAADYEAALRTVAYRNTAGVPAEGVRSVTFTARDASASSNSVSRAVVVTANGFFVEQGGLVVLEAEHFTGQAPGAGSTAGSGWTVTADVPDFSGEAAVRADPNVGVGAGDTTNGPRLDYAVYFATAGTYYLWVRMLGPTATDDSVHAGLEGEAATLGGLGITDGRGAWAWKDRVDGRPGDVRVTVRVESAGLHTVNLWMREDGVLVDKLVLTTNPAFQPGAIDGGLGPPESSH